MSTYCFLFFVVVVVGTGFSVSTSGSCMGYSWDVEWSSRRGDQPEMGVVAVNLGGPDQANISLETVRDGGVWIRPLRGDMLRLPEMEPQVCVCVCVCVCVFVISQHNTLI